MILIVLFISIMIILILINYLSYEAFEDTEYPYLFSINEISKSPIGYRGVFASKDYKKGDILEVCPCIKQEYKNISGRIKDYVFSFDKKHVLIAFGYCSMYNHSDDPNASWQILSENQMLIIVEKDIKKGEEIFVSYGEGYWEQRNENKNKV